MMIEGSSVHRELQASAKDARLELADRAEDLADEQRRVDALIRERTVAIEDLVKQQAPDLRDESLKDVFTGVRDELKGVQERRKRKIQDLHDETAVLLRRKEDAERTLDSITLELDALVDRRGKLEETAAERLAADPKFSVLSEEATRAEARLTRDEEREEELTLEANEKRPNYENSRLFMYLYKRGFDTPRYTKKGFTRRADRWLAEFIDYRRAKAGYDFITTTPELVAAEVALRRTLFEELMTKVEAIESRVAKEVGLTAVITQGEAIGAKRDAQVEVIGENTQENEARNTELVELMEARGAFYREAIDRLRAFIERTERPTLSRQAAATPDSADDVLVRELTKLETETTRLKPRLRDLRSEVSRHEQQVHELETLVQDFRRANFDSARSFFRSLNTGEILALVQSGEMDSRGAFREMRRQQQFRPPPISRRSISTGSARGMGDLLGHPASRILIGAMGNAVRSALRGSVGRSVARRRSGGLGGSRGGSRRPSSGGRRGGFTTIDGF